MLFYNNIKCYYKILMDFKLLLNSFFDNNVILLSINMHGKIIIKTFNDEMIKTFILKVHLTYSFQNFYLVLKNF